MNITTQPQHTQDLLALKACPEAIRWARTCADMDEVWAACERGDWMLWLVGRLSGDDPESAERRKVVLAACACARLALKHVPDGEDRPRVAIETAEAWARAEGGVMLADVRRAAAAAYAAADAADAADAAYAVDAADAAYAAADAAVDADAAYAAAYARAGTLKQCADIVREHYPVAPVMAERAKGGECE